MPQSLIEIIEVQQLFGKFSYVVPKYGNLISPTILYGDNGVGKSTILTIIFHLLSAANDKGHRTSLRKIPFKLVSVTLTDGVVIEAYRDTDNASAILHFKIRRQDATIAHWQYSNHENVYITELNDYHIQTKDFDYSLSGNDDLSSYVVDTITSGPVDYDNNGVAVSNSSYIKALVEFAPKMFYLSADRKLEGDSVSEVLPASDLRRPSPKRGTERALDYLRASRNASLDHALESAARWVNRRAVSDANRGTENTHSAYETILRQISAEFRQHQSVEDIPDIAGISTTVDKIELITDSLSKYELASKLNMDKFRIALNSSSTAIFTAKIVYPYLKDLNTRLDAIIPLYEVVNNFVLTINSFLTGKEIGYTLSRGFYITDSTGVELHSSDLSSGEQQLLLMFSHVLSAREFRSIFIIDEPELSLNVKWQRNLVHALLSVASNSPIQFIFASHSIELIAQYSENVVEIGR